MNLQFQISEFFENSIITCGHDSDTCHVYRRDLTWNTTKGDWPQYGVKLPSNFVHGQKSLVHGNFWYMAPNPYIVKHKFYNRWETWTSPPQKQSGFGCFGKH